MKTLASTTRRFARLAALAAALVAGLVAGLAPAAAVASDKPIRLAQNQPLELGRLDCMVVPGSRRNLVISSTALVDCVFEPSAGPATYYRGETGIGLGIDLSVKSDDRFTFLVLTARPAAPDFSGYPLAGRYYGAEATVSLGISAGAGYLYLEPAR